MTANVVYAAWVVKNAILAPMDAHTVRHVASATSPLTIWTIYVPSFKMSKQFQWDILYTTIDSIRLTIILHSSNST